MTKRRSWFTRRREQRRQLERLQELALRHPHEMADMIVLLGDLADLMAHVADPATPVETIDTDRIEALTSRLLVAAEKHGLVETTTLSA